MALRRLSRGSQKVPLILTTPPPPPRPTFWNLMAKNPRHPTKRTPNRTPPNPGCGLGGAQRLAVEGAIWACLFLQDVHLKQKTNPLWFPFGTSKKGAPLQKTSRPFESKLDTRLRNQSWLAPCCAVGHQAAVGLFKGTLESQSKPGTKVVYPEPCFKS